MSSDHDFPAAADQEAPAHVDLYALTKDHIQDPPGTLWAAFRQIGPGLVLAASIVGTGELIAATTLGAKAGFALLWLILVSCVIKVFVQIELGRYAITHGKTSLAAFNTLPGPRLGASWLCWAWLVMMLFTQSQIATMEGLIGQAAHMAFPAVSTGLATGVGKVVPPAGAWLQGHPEVPWAAATALAAIALLWSGGYKRLEKITTILVASVTFFTIVWVIGLQTTTYAITWEDSGAGFAFRMPADAATLALAFTAFGITGVGASELFAYPYWCIEKGYARAAGPRTPDNAWAVRARGWMRVMRLDAWFSLAVYTVATVAFYLLGAAVLNSQKETDLPDAELVSKLSGMYLDPLKGTALAWLAPATVVGFLIGVWAILFKTLYVATAGNARLVADLFDLAGIWPIASQAQRDRVVRVICVFLPLFALGIYLIVQKPLFLVMVGGTAQAIMLPFIAGATLYLRYRDVDPRVGPSRWSDAFTILATVALAGFAAYKLLALIS